MVHTTIQPNAGAKVRVWGSQVGITSGTNFQIVRGAWATNQKIEITKLIVTNLSGLPGFVNIWDQDLSSTTAVGFGSSTGPLLTVPYGATSTSGIIPVQTILNEEQLPNIVFEAGIAIQSNGLGTQVVWEGYRT